MKVGAILPCKIVRQGLETTAEVSVVVSHDDVLILSIETGIKYPSVIATSADDEGNAVIDIRLSKDTPYMSDYAYAMQRHNATVLQVAIGERWQQFMIERNQRYGASIVYLKGK